MAMTWDLTDIPAVDAADLAAAMRSLIEDGRGLVLINGATDADLDTARAALQSRHHAEPQRALAAFVRFRHLVEVFGARRLKDLMLDNGYALMAPAIAIASSLRLNGNRGFNPQRFLLSLQEALAANVVTLETALLPLEAGGSPPNGDGQHEAVRQQAAAAAAMAGAAPLTAPSSRTASCARCSRGEQTALDHHAETPRRRGP